MARTSMQEVTNWALDWNLKHSPSHSTQALYPDVLQHRYPKNLVSLCNVLCPGCKLTSVSITSVSTETKKTKL